jgi:hypothetical protein
MPTLLDYLKGVAQEYAEPLRDAAMGELNDVLERSAAKLKDPKALRGLVRSFGAGLAESWRKCPHGEESEAVCSRCVSKE